MTEVGRALDAFEEDGEICAIFFTGSERAFAVPEHYPTPRYKGQSAPQSLLRGQAYPLSYYTQYTERRALQQLCSKYITKECYHIFP
ncbi:hypothetical protein SKAU_G00424440 [Synaphobranchus kaupii]|uniref:Uncharacterized protein n=1 Tax=Synaphobranchus kaupii TaxID=118154 RepID=A0A9Q1I9V3_SYNKA|nr:hypothetical protein SKAU_G00424440 [Synaphobranchus kaupii]